MFSKHLVIYFSVDHDGGQQTNVLSWTCILHNTFNYFQNFSNLIDSKYNSTLEISPTASFIDCFFVYVVGDLFVEYYPSTCSSFSKLVCFIFLSSKGKFQQFIIGNYSSPSKIVHINFSGFKFSRQLGFLGKFNLFYFQ